MSVKDVCELSSLIHGHEIKKTFIEKKLLTLNSSLNQQNQRLQNEMDQYQRALEAQNEIFDSIKSFNANVDVEWTHFQEMKNEEIEKEHLLLVNKLTDTIYKKNLLATEIEDISTKLCKLETTFIDSNFIETYKNTLEELNQQSYLEDEKQKDSKKVHILIDEERACLEKLDEEIQSFNHELSGILIEKDTVHAESNLIIQKLSENEMKLRNLIDENCIMESDYYTKISNGLATEKNLKEGISMMTEKLMFFSKLIEQKQDELQQIELMISSTLESTDNFQRRHNSLVDHNRGLVQEIENIKNDFERYQVELNDVNYEIEKQKTKISSYHGLSQLRESAKGVCLNTESIALEIQKLRFEIENIKTLIDMANGNGFASELKETLSSDHENYSIFTQIVETLDALSKNAKRKEELTNQYQYLINNETILRQKECFDLSIKFEDQVRLVRELSDVRDSLDEENLVLDEKINGENNNLETTDWIPKQLTEIVTNETQLDQDILRFDTEIDSVKAHIHAIEMQVKRLSKDRTVQYPNQMDTEQFNKDVNQQVEEFRIKYLQEKKEEISNLREILTKEDKKFQEIYLTTETDFKYEESQLELQLHELKQESQNYVTEENILSERLQSELERRHEILNEARDVNLPGFRETAMSTTSDKKTGDMMETENQPQHVNHQDNQSRKEKSVSKVMNKPLKLNKQDNRVIQNPTTNSSKRANSQTTWDDDSVDHIFFPRKTTLSSQLSRTNDAIDEWEELTNSKQVSSHRKQIVNHKLTSLLSTDGLNKQK